MSEIHAMVSLLEQVHSDQIEMARPFGCSAHTVWRQRRFAQSGLATLGWLRLAVRRNPAPESSSHK